MGQGRKRAWAELREDFRPPTASATVCARADLFAEYEDLKRRWEEAKESDRGRETAADELAAPALYDQLQALRGQMLGSQVTFTFQGIGRLAEATLRNQHPPTDEQKRLAEAEDLQALFDPDTYIPALLHAACIEPDGMALEDWAGIYDTWTLGQQAPLRKAAFAVNNAGTEVPKGVRPSSDREP